MLAECGCVRSGPYASGVQGRTWGANRWQPSDGPGSGRPWEGGALNQGPHHTSGALTSSPSIPHTNFLSQRKPARSGRSEGPADWTSGHSPARSGAVVEGADRHAPGFSRKRAIFTQKLEQMF